MLLGRLFNLTLRDLWPEVTTCHLQLLDMGSQTHFAMPYWFKADPLPFLWEREWILRETLGTQLHSLLFAVWIKAKTLQKQKMTSKMCNQVRLPHIEYSRLLWFKISHDLKFTLYNNAVAVNQCLYQSKVILLHLLQLYVEQLLLLPIS